MYDKLKEILSMEVPSVGFYQLKESGELEKLFPELFDMIGKEHKVEHHSEGDVFEHTMMVLDQTKKDDLEVKFAALYHDIGKPSTYDSEKKTFFSHDNDNFSEKPMILLEERLSKDISEEELVELKSMLKMAKASINFHHKLRDIFNIENKVRPKIKGIMKILESLKNYSFDEKQLINLVKSINADTNGRISAKLLNNDDLSKKEKTSIIDRIGYLSKEEVDILVKSDGNGKKMIKNIEIDGKSYQIEFEHNEETLSIINSEKLIKILDLMKCNDFEKINQIIKDNGMLLKVDDKLISEMLLFNDEKKLLKITNEKGKESINNSIEELNAYISNATTSTELDDEIKDKVEDKISKVKNDIINTFVENQLDVSQNMDIINKLNVITFKDGRYKLQYDNANGTLTQSPCKSTEIYRSEDYSMESFTPQGK